MTSLPITLHQEFIPTVSAGDFVKTGDVIAKKSEAKEISVNIAEELGVSPRQAIKTLKKNPGDNIKPGDTLAVKKGMLGLHENSVESQIAGTLMRFERDRGVLVIKQHTDEAASDTSAELLSPIDGTVSMCDNKRIVIDTDKNILPGISGVGGTCQGELFILKESEGKEHVESYQLTPATIGKIVVGKTFDREVFFKAVGIGVIGVIAMHVGKEDLAYAAKKQLLIPLISVNEEMYHVLEQMNEKTVYMDANTAAILPLTV